jgi:hypothetical protein
MKCSARSPLRYRSSRNTATSRRSLGGRWKSRSLKKCPTRSNLRTLTGEPISARMPSAVTSLVRSILCSRVQVAASQLRSSLETSCRRGRTRSQPRRANMILSSLKHLERGTPNKVTFARRNPMTLSTSSDSYSRYMTAAKWTCKLKIKCQ